MLKRLGRSELIQKLGARIAVAYLRLVRATTSYVREPADMSARMFANAPLIFAMWHGQHLTIHFAGPEGLPIRPLISKSADGDFNARVLEKFGVVPIRGSGGSGAKSRKRGGAAALREMLREIARGQSVALTADVPKVSRIAGLGIVTLAQLSGRPIVPLAVVSSRRIDWNSWDHASLALPFGRGAMVLGDPIVVARDADAETLEAARQAVETGLNEAHARAYALVGSRDPGAAVEAKAVEAMP
jgi:lysophospholipid acyltransferase (LPLAT)-like uncharacterized protein